MSTFRWLVLGLVLLLAATLGMREVQSPDLPQHLITGAWIAENGAVPVVDEWSVLSDGQPWLVAHWLAQLPMTALYRIGGITLLQLATVAWLWLALLGALAVAGRRGIHAGFVWPLAVLALFASHHRFEPRPGLVSILFPCLLVVLLDFISSRERSRGRLLSAIGGIVVIQVIWTNSHGSFILGPLTIAAYLAGALLWRADTGDRRPLLGALVLSLVAIFVNPRGAVVWSLFQPYVDAVTLRATGQDSGTIQEWSPSFSEFSRTHLYGAWGPYIALLVLTLLALLLAGDRLHGPRGLVLTMFATLSVTANRNIAPFAFVALGILPGIIEAGLSRWPGFFSRRVRWSLLVAGALPALVLASSVGTNRFFVNRYKMTAIAPGFSATAFPFRACSWVEAADIQGQAFHNFDMGSYYLWRFGLNKKSFVDGRLDLLAPTELARYQRSIRDPALFEGMVDEFGITHVILKYSSPETIPLVSYLEANKGRWTRVFLDGAGVVYLPAGTRVPTVSPAEKPHPWDVAARRWWQPLSRVQVHLPVEEINLAGFFEIAGEPENAIVHLENALARKGDLVIARIRLATLYAAAGNRAKSAEHLDWLEANRPNDPRVESLLHALSN